MNKVMEYMALGKPIVQFDLTESRYSAGDAAVYAKRNIATDLGDRSWTCWTIRKSGRRWVSSGVSGSKPCLPGNIRVPSC